MTEANTVRILIVEDQLITRTGLKMLLEQTPSFCVVGEAADGIEALKQAILLKPDVVLMDIVLPGMDGIEATERIKRRFRSRES
ncbi:MAG TPA: response regulator transcription factor [Candidatus Obscuribacterales bacterium]